MNKYAILIGVNKYEDALGPLNCAAQDARVLEGLLVHKCGFKTRYLEQDNLDSGVVERAIEKAGKVLAGGGIFIFYFAGHGKQHGTNQLMLLPGARSALLEKGNVQASGVFSYKTLLDLTNGWKNVQRLFIFDACRSLLPTRNGVIRPAFEGIGVKRNPGFANKADWEADRNFTELNSCGHDQASLELPESKGGPGHGVFTLALLDSLKTAVDSKQPVLVDVGFVANLRVRMGRIAEDHGMSLCGEPTFHGEQLLLWDGQPESQHCGAPAEDDRLDRLKMLETLRTNFERQLKHWQIEQPPGDNCLETIRLLASFDCDDEELRGFGHRLNLGIKEHDDLEMRRRDEQRIAVARAVRTEDAYAKYLASCEGCEHRGEAEREIQLLKERSDAALWANVAGNLDRFTGAANQWQTDKYRQMAQKEIGDLRENVLWKECRATNTEKSYRRYLKESELCNFEKEAKERLAALIKTDPEWLRVPQKIPGDSNRLIRLVGGAFITVGVLVVFFVMVISSTSPPSPHPLPLPSIIYEQKIDPVASTQPSPAISPKAKEKPQMSSSAADRADDSAAPSPPQGQSMLRPEVGAPDVASHPADDVTTKNPEKPNKEKPAAPPVGKESLPKPDASSAPSRIVMMQKNTESGDQARQYELGVLCETTQNYQKAAECYRKAADQGNLDAQVKLGDLHLSGRGLSRSYDDALKWYKSATEQGHVEAPRKLGEMYEKGKGVTRDYNEALRCYRLAMNRGDARSEEKIKALLVRGH